MTSLGAVVVADSSAHSTVDDASSAQEKLHSAAQSGFLDIRVDPESFRRVEEIVAEKSTAGIA